MTTKIYNSYSDFLKREDKSKNGVSEEFAAQYPDFEKQNETNQSCWNCTNCSRCSRCSNCYDCSECSGLHKNAPQSLIIPTLENIHQKVLDAVSNPGALDMGDWHTCDTTHCRAGWVCHLAGKEGKEFEEKTSTLFAAMQIYHKSCPEIKVSPSRFFESNEVAMKDIIRCAEEEKKLVK